MFFEDAVRPIREADFFFGSGMRLRQNRNQYPSERWLGGAILAARRGKTQILQWPKSSTGFSLWGLVIARTKPRRLKPAPQSNSLNSS
jgi:hypothetical protein